ncbi:MOXD1 homolog 2-like [Malaya genurostris]|uniref:MOXD1 homolog 2-like n=1 Tax=Malaya genurostris TaxID=325434 RepID=UPI0026F3FD10|nr:MOXD1 homolog 2-like [Malaya genurostris]XP_058465518.1 MOXD1 homolog 2-like [Malaya genurostris]XP_058465519.1 MOXD1 homolog 2-like [Malaya genurostris]XP_058465520.1 MOXD1 homolog 2-like [Malaya genurostris]XP_058465521.1 MOXD1 homolog 2-like [Malaya genurostris]XP_058465523.1 MOXD1 homolog 2-like [Malaya genurostris]
MKAYHAIMKILARQQITSLRKCCLCMLIVWCSALPVTVSQWDHMMDFDHNYRLLWTSNNQDITFEIQARTLGYVGLGFSHDGTLADSDIVIGWIDQGHVLLQDRHIRAESDGDPVVDSSQDYTVLLGYENVTHTVIRFKRNLETCDNKDDTPITNDTMRVIFMYSKQKPIKGSTLPGTLPAPLEAFRGSRSVFLTQRTNQHPLPNPSSISILELRNEDVELPESDESLYWCKIFKLDDFHEKHHLVRYEPVFDSSTSVLYLNHMILYECQGLSKELEMLSRERGQPCFRMQPMHCNTVVANWARGSDGFSFPRETGYPLDSHQATYYMLETHYNNPDYSYDFSSFYQKNLSKQQRIMNTHGDDDDDNDDADDEDTANENTDQDERNQEEYAAESESDVGPESDAANEQQVVDNSGLKLYYTQSLRNFDAGVLSVGLDPNWRHIIPPGQEKVVSEGHCIGSCTQKGFPKEGINIFAVMTRTHLIGRQVKLRQIRGSEEHEPIVHDTNIDPSYRDYRRLPAPVKVLPGDNLIAECIYDSSSRKSITLGGMTTREEICLVLTLYYPRQKELTSCHSLPSLPTVLHSLGIQELASGTNPVVIASPSELAGMTLEKRLTSYDWANQFESFQYVTQRGSFKPLCWTPNNSMLPGIEMESYGSNITHYWKPTNKCRNIHTNMVTEPMQDGSQPNMIDLPAMDDHESTNMVDADLRAKVARPNRNASNQGGGRPTSSVGHSQSNHNIPPEGIVLVTLVLVAISRLVIGLI